VDWGLPRDVLLVIKLGRELGRGFAVGVRATELIPVRLGKRRLDRERENEQQKSVSHQGILARRDVWSELQN
jgi:hypothetical protein